MQFDKSTIVPFLQQQGQNDKAQQVQQQLPQQVDHAQDADLLQRLGINPQDLVSQLGGGKLGDVMKKLSRSAPRSVRAAAATAGGSARGAPP
jgi:hypothetical protein